MSKTLLRHTLIIFITGLCICAIPGIVNVLINGESLLKPVIYLVNQHTMADRCHSVCNFLG
jgi:hypothetical protein